MNTYGLYKTMLIFYLATDFWITLLGVKSSNPSNECNELECNEGPEHGRHVLGTCLSNRISDIYDVLLSCKPFILFDSLLVYTKSRYILIIKINLISDQEKLHIFILHVTSKNATVLIYIFYKSNTRHCLISDHSQWSRG